ncbi:DUF4139 domain-containing protein [Rhodovulum strictum]|uniref:Mucoidy inhibitor MuiA family protein n=1 Tax=Rhodovulum strictum TaxID=58314 RepID=A0A844B8X6_9RHOB|nr:DUF4139 domain-containing protein [Rhodovulum strictum]MRH22060.1 mucoidy inhibitor MuiA family protein [Rhodovulum strictum]
MRRLALALSLAVTPATLLAADFPLTSAVSAVTLYPQGATVTRAVPYDIPAGRHRLILTDLPATTPLHAVRVGVTGATLGGVTARADFVPPRSAEKDAALAAAEAEVERLDDALRSAEADIAAIRLEAEAARARIAFFERLGTTELPQGTDIAALAVTIGAGTLDALRSAHAAEQRAEAADRGLKELREALARARQALAALVPEDEARALLTVELWSDTPASGDLTVSYTIAEAGWTPVYDLRLDRAAGRLDIERGAFVAQATGENWAGVALTLSTVRPAEQIAPGEVWPDLRRIADPGQIMPRLGGVPMAEADMARGGVELAAAPAPKVEAVAMADALAVSYVYPDPVDIAAGADRVRLALGNLTAPAEIFARAVPLRDSSGFVTAAFANTSDELILPTAEAMFHLDGRFVGQQSLALIPAGAEAELSFGPIDGLRLTRIVDRSEGDRGVIRKSNEWAERVRIGVENLTAEPWSVRLTDRVPYSEQDDLKITWSADPPPARSDIDGRRGVLEWRFDLGPGASQEIGLTQRMTWPEGKVLQ